MKRNTFILIALTVLTVNALSQTLSRKITPEMLHNQQKINEILASEHSVSSDYYMKQTSGNGPSFKWAKKIGGNGGSELKDIIYLDNGHMILAGSFSGEMEYDGQSMTSEGLRDIFLMEVDADHKLVWSTQFKANMDYMTSATDICPGDNCIYLAGYFTGGELELPNSTITSTQESMVFIIKLDPSGNDLWHHTFQDVGTLVNNRAFTYDDSEEQLIGLLCNGDYSKIVKLSSEGEILKDNNTDAIFYDLLMHNDTIIFAGKFTGNELYLGGLHFYGNSNSNALLAKASYKDYWQWEWGLVAVSWTPSQLSTPGGNFEYICIDNSNNILTSGIFTEGLYFDNQIEIVSDYYHGGFLAKISPGHELKWVKVQQTFERDRHSFVSCLGDKIYTTGAYFDEAVFDEFILTGGSYFFATYNSNGEFIDAENIDTKMLSLNTYQSQSIHCTGIHNYNACLTEINSNENENLLLKIHGNSGICEATRECLTRDEENNLYSSGYFEGTWVYENQAGTEQKRAAYILKTDKNGNELLHNIIETDGEIFPESIFVDQNGHVYTTGYFDGTLNCGIYSIASENPTGYVLKLDDEFNPLWLVKAASQGSTTPQNIIVKNNGKIYISGTFSGEININDQEYISYGREDAFIAALSQENGNVDWFMQAGGESVEYSSFITSDHEGNLYMAGEFISDTIYLTGNTSIEMPEGAGNILFLKLSNNNEIIYHTLFGGGIDGEYGTWPHSVQCDDNNNVYMIGWHGNNAQFGDYILPAEWGFGYNSFVAKIAPSGDVNWAKSINRKHWGWVSWNIDFDYLGNCYFGGNYIDSTEFNNEILFYSEKLSLFTISYDADGNFRWVRNIPCRPAYNYLNAVAVFDTNQLVASGCNNSIISFDDIQLRNYSTFSFLAFQGEGFSGTDEYLTNNDLIITPSPARDFFKIKLPDKLHSNSEINIYSIAGKKVFSGKAKSGKSMIRIECSNFPPGTYLITLQENQKYTYGKINIIK